MNYIVRRALFVFGITMLLFAASPVIGYAATLTLSPASGSYSVGQIVTVTIMLNTTGAAIDGVDINALSFDPALFQIQDENAVQSGVQIAPGTLMPVTPFNSVDSTMGKIRFSQVTSGGTTYQNSTNQVLATFRARVLAIGTGGFTFSHTPGSTTDTNVAVGGSDMLTSVGNANFTLGDLTAPSTPTGLTATAVSPSQINLSWTASVDNVGVTGYRVYRNGTQVGTSSGTMYSDTGLASATLYSYTVQGVDAAGNVSAQSSVASATTQAPPNALPTGALDGAIPTDIWGWAYDPDAGDNPIQVHIYVDGVLAQALTANLSRPDLVPAKTPHPNHGFSWKGFELAPGTHTVEAFAINTPAGPNPSLGTKTLTIIADTTPPTRSGAAPTGTLAAGTTSATLSLTTNENATCKYGTAAGTSYASLSSVFSTTGGTSHSNILSGLSAGSYVYYVRCQDTAGNANPDDFPISFSIAASHVTAATFTPALEGRTSLTGISFTVSFFLPGGTAPVTSFSAVPDGTGKISLPGGVTLAQGLYDLYIKAGGYLRGKQSGVNVLSGSAITLPTLLAGDLNDDAIINSFDWSLMNANWFGTTGVSDINADGTINSLDFSYLNKNWNKLGA